MVDDVRHQQAASTSVLWEADGQRRRSDFVGEQIFLVEKENHGGVDEPTIIADRVKQLHALSHSILTTKTNTSANWLLQCQINNTDHYFKTSINAYLITHFLVRKHKP